MPRLVFPFSGPCSKCSSKLLGAVVWWTTTVPSYAAPMAMAVKRLPRHVEEQAGALLGGRETRRAVPAGGPGRGRVVVDGQRGGLRVVAVGRPAGGERQQPRGDQGRAALAGTRPARGAGTSGGGTSGGGASGGGAGRGGAGRGGAGGAATGDDVVGGAADGERK